MALTIKTVLLFLLLLAFTFPQTIFAASWQQRASAPSALLAVHTVPASEDPRVKVLYGFLEVYDSPLAASAQTFIKAADTYNLDWRFVAAISGVESTFGHQIPYGTYNAWGWGIYGDNMIYFSSFDEGIEIISKDLRETYMDKWEAKDTYAIGRYYAASPTWASRVEYFMNNIKEYELKHPAKSLSLSI